MSKYEVGRLVIHRNTGEIGIIAEVKETDSGVYYDVSLEGTYNQDHQAPDLATFDEENLEALNGSF